jgi:hypothetical protein
LVTLFYNISFEIWPAVTSITNSSAVMHQLLWWITWLAHLQAFDDSDCSYYNLMFNTQNHI